MCNGTSYYKYSFQKAVETNYTAQVFWLMVWAMPIAPRRNSANPIQRSKFTQRVSVYESPEANDIAGDGRFPVEERTREEDLESASSSSSIGRNSDVSGGSSESEDLNEVQSSFKGPLDSLDSLEEVLPIK